MMIREKKISTLCIGNCPTASTLVKICLRNHISLKGLRKVQISHALELIPLFNIDDDDLCKEN